MRVKHAVLLIVIFFLAAIGDARGKSVDDSLNVSARVSQRLEFRIVRDPHRLEITRSGARKGFESVVNGTVISVVTNNLEGYVLAVSARGHVREVKKKHDEDDKDGKKEKHDRDEKKGDGGTFTSVTLTMDGNSYYLPADGEIEIHVPFKKMKPIVKKISYRFLLAPGVGPGLYHWPLNVNVLPL